MRGEIKALSPTFGFIKADGLDWFFHLESVVGALDFEHLAVGDTVTFEPVTPQPAKGRRAQLVAWQPPNPTAPAVTTRNSAEE